MQSIRSVTVYLSSSSDVADVYHAAAVSLGRAIAAAGWTLVYGGNNIGLMGNSPAPHDRRVEKSSASRRV